MIRQTAGDNAQRNAFALIGAGAGARILGLGAGALLGVVTTSLAVRLLGPSLYGFLAFSISVMTTVALFCRLGLEPGVAREVASLDPTGDKGALRAAGRGALSLVAWSTIAGGTVIAAIILLGPAPVGMTTRVGFVVALCLLLYASNAAAVAMAIARGLGHMLLMEVPNLVLTAAKCLVIVLLFAAATANLGWVAAGYGAAAAATALVAGLMAKWMTSDSRSLFAPSLTAARRAATKYLPFAVAILGTITIARFDVIVLGLSAPSREVGVYEPTLKIVEQLMLLVPMMGVAPFLPAATGLYRSGERAALEELYVSTSKLSFVVSFLAVIVLAAFPQPLFETLYGRAFPLDPAIPSILLIGFVVNLAAGLNGSALAAIGNRRSLFRVGLGTAATMVVLAVTLVPAWGAVGAALATSATYVFLNVATGVAVYVKSGVHPIRGDMVGTLLSSVLPLTAALWIGSTTSPQLAGAVGWSVALWAFWVALLLRSRFVKWSEFSRLSPWTRAEAR